MNHGKSATVVADPPLAQRRTQRRSGELQMDPTTHGCLYSFLLQDPTGGVLDPFEVFAVGPTAVGADPTTIYNAMTEYWQVPPALPVRAARSLVVRASAQATPIAPAGFPEAGTTPFCMPARPAWSPAAALPARAPGLFFWSGGDTPTGPITRAAALDLSNIEEGRVRWYQWSARGTADPYIVSPSSMVDGLMAWSADPPAVPAGGSCWSVDLAGLPRPGDPVAPQPAHCWLFSQTASPGSNVARDSVGHSGGRLSGAASFPPYLANGLVELAGDTSRVDFGEEVLSPGTLPFTVALWLRAAETEPSARALSVLARPAFSAGSAGLRIELFPESTDRARLSVSLGPDTLSVSLTTGESHHLALTRRDDVDGSQTLAFYIDGTLAASQRGASVDLSGSAPLCLGSSPDAPDTPAVSGRIGDLRIYTQALGEREIIQIATRYLPP